jgi:PTH1 family peptidyl-tRNA hydrolase
MGDDLTLVVGLGNPGPQYVGNRHNIGFLVVDELADRIGGGRFKSHKSNADVLTGRMGDRPIVLAKPRTYMNLSGAPVTNLCRFYKVLPESLIVIHDELDVPFDAVRLKLGGGDNGHNGLRSITQSLGTRDYHRVRVGIGRPPGRMDPADFVLRDFSLVERKELTFVIDKAADAVSALLTNGLTAAQNTFH